MPLETPDLDDRTFEDLVSEATSRVRQSCPAWTDLGASDPGVVLLEVFAYLTDLMIYRLNRLPVKAYIEFLRLMGIRLYPPRAARAELRFTLEQAASKGITIPELTRVTVGRAGAGQTAPVFMTGSSVRFEPGMTEVTAAAYHVDWIDAELAGTGTGAPGQTVQLKNPPVVAPTPDFDELIVGVEEPSLEAAERTGYRSHGNKVFRICREVDRFMGDQGSGYPFLIDRAIGLITFASSISVRAEDGTPAAPADVMADVPAAGREIRVWYCTGGGPHGNVAQDTLTVLKDVIPGVAVTNPLPATGGTSAESVENALRRGPQELHSLQRAVTARDFEMLAERNAGASRAKAFTQAELWAHAVPGTARILLVPAWPESSARADGSVTAARLHEQETPAALREIEATFNEIKPLGTRCEVGWVRYKTVRVKADIVVYRGENPEAVQARVLQNLHEAINPLPTSRSRVGWPFGEPLRVSRVYDLILSEKSVSYADQVRLLVDDVPDKDVVAVAADCHQPHTWYATVPGALFRSMNDADSWERVATFQDAPSIVTPHPDKPGFLAVVSSSGDESGSKVHLSTDCGETWRDWLAEFAFTIEDMAWLSRSDGEILLLATNKGLYELSVSAAEPSPVQILVDPAVEDLGFNAIVAFSDIRGATNVAVSAQRGRGVYLSVEAAKPGSFTPIGLQDEDVRTLAVQKVGPRSFIWAGLAIPGNEAGKGCFRWEATGSTQSPDGWHQYGKDWVGGSCNAIAFDGGTVYAATHHSGVVMLASDDQEPAWVAPNLRSGLPTRDITAKETGRIFLTVNAAAVAAGAPVILAGGAEGIYRSSDSGATYVNVSQQEFHERVALPQTWLFCSGAHEISVVKEHETRRN